MRERLIEFQEELYDMDFTKYTDKELKKLYDDWNSYIRKGGVRPGRPH